MKQLVVGLLLVLGSSLAWADASSITPTDSSYFGTAKVDAVLQNPGAVIAGTQSAVNTVQPSVEELLNFRTGEWKTGTSIALWNLSSKSFPLGSLRAGYAVDFLPFGEVQLDVPGITQRFIVPSLPSSVTGTLRAGALDGIWKLIGKYGHTGVFLGYDFQRDDTSHVKGVAVGVSLGGRFTF